MSTPAGDEGGPDGLLGAALLPGASFFLGYFVLIQRGLSGAVIWHAAADVIALVFALVFVIG